jgi:hypothetical protein
MDSIVLLPMSRRIEPKDGVFTANPQRQFIHLDPDMCAELVGAGRVIQAAARNELRREWHLVAGSSRLAASLATGVIDISIVRFEHDRNQYTLDIQPDHIDIRASSPQSAFHAAHTLAQLFRQFPDALPCLHIEDAPDFPVRGVMIDISRDKVPTMSTLFGLVDLLASMKINQLQLYTEHTFAYRNHREVWAEASPMTGEEILTLDAYCRERFIELVPNQNSFGHMERWLKLPRYEPLAETPDGFSFPWGLKHAGGFTLDPGNPQSLALVESLYDELLPHFSSRLFNVGCDETFDLGLGKSKAECDARGKERVYLDFLLKIYRAVKERGHQMMFWGDIILHKPELIPELPKDMIALNWGYDIGHPFDRETRALRDAGVPFYVCPGTSSWLSISGRTDNCIANLQDAAKQGLANGAIGFLNTDWGDVGHLQYLPASYLGFAAGAAYSWCLESNRDASLADQLSLHVFRDSTRTMGQLMCDFGNVYQAVKSKQFNSAAMFWSFIGGEERKKMYEGITLDEIVETESRLKEIEHRSSKPRMNRDDAIVICDEIRNGIAMLKHGCARGRLRLGAASREPAKLASDLRQIIGTHEKLWLARNRVGGLRDSIRRMENRLADYGAKGTGSAFG